MNTIDSYRQRMIYALRVKKNGQTIQRYHTHNLRRFLKNIRTIKWQNLKIEVYVKVSYGKQKDIHGKTVVFYNDGIYENRRDLIQAVKAFIEK
jgi:hypothetical protein